MDWEIIWSRILFVLILISAVAGATTTTILLVDRSDYSAGQDAVLTIIELATRTQPVVPVQVNGATFYCVSETSLNGLVESISGQQTTNPN